VAGLDVLIGGLALSSGSDDDTLTIIGRLFDRICEHTRRQLITARPPSQPRSLTSSRTGCERGAPVRRDQCHEEAYRTGRSQGSR